VAGRAVAARSDPAELCARSRVARAARPPPSLPSQGQALVRFRRSLVEARSDCRNRILKLLESAHIKLASVATEVFGVSGMAMLQAIVALPER